MAIKISCTKCNKKISIDEAFAGGMCRCPYCSAIVAVPGSLSPGGTVGRPSAPPPSRPAAPTGRPAAPAAGARPSVPPPTPAPSAVPPLPDEAPIEADTPVHIPTAQPVKIQGIISIVLLVMSLFLIGGISYALYSLFIKGPPGPPPALETGNPLDPPKDGSAGISMVKLGKGPIVYVVDYGSSMRDTYDSAVDMVRRSVPSLKGKYEYTVLMSGETEDKFVPPQFVKDDSGVKAIEAFLQADATPKGASEIPRALKAALDRKPREIVLIARSNSVMDTAEVAKQAKEQGVKIHTIAIDLEGDLEKLSALSELAKTTGGTSIAVNSGSFR